MNLAENNGSRMLFLLLTSPAGCLPSRLEIMVLEKLWVVPLPLFFYYKLCKQLNVGLLGHNNKSNKRHKVFTENQQGFSGTGSK